MNEPWTLSTGWALLILSGVTVASCAIVWAVTASYYRGRLTETLRAIVEARETEMIQGTNIRRVE